MRVVPAPASMGLIALAAWGHATQAIGALLADVRFRSGDGAASHAARPSQGLVRVSGDILVEFAGWMPADLPAGYVGPVGMRQTDVNPGGPAAHRHLTHATPARAAGVCVHEKSSEKRLHRKRLQRAVRHAQGQRHGLCAALMTGEPARIRRAGAFHEAHYRSFVVVCMSAVLSASAGSRPGCRHLQRRLGHARPGW